ncbi:hypothetical protein EI42_05338 [Thermosporothrix hazakensis]|uniref:Uncharacterized protein n=2 Tax=Thermosporothrix TaxID=768650 RepID=A0A326U2A2_THEHA|nr:hypothetical protein EI42_05338 [Thermosporothrix hazakensis]
MQEQQLQRAREARLVVQITEEAIRQAIRQAPQKAGQSGHTHG